MPRQVLRAAAARRYRPLVIETLSVATLLGLLFGSAAAAAELARRLARRR